MNRTLRSCAVPNGSVSGFIVPWLQTLAADPAPKIGLAAVIVVIQAFQDAVTVLSIVALCFWALDFLTGVVSVLRREGVPGLRWEKAGDSFLKLMLYGAMWIFASLVQITITESGLVDPRGTIVAAACSVIIFMEATSAAENVQAGLPGTRAFFGAALRLIRPLRETPRGPHLRDVEQENEK